MVVMQTLFLNNSIKKKVNEQRQSFTVRPKSPLEPNQMLLNQFLPEKLQGALANKISSDLGERGGINSNPNPPNPSKEASPSPKKRERKIK